MIDSVLRGTGIYGAAVSTLKNVLWKWHEERQKPGWKRDDWNIMQEAINLSPPIGIKARKLYSAAQTWEFNDDVIDYMDKTDIDNPMWEAVAFIPVTTGGRVLRRPVNPIFGGASTAGPKSSAWREVASPVLGTTPSIAGTSSGEGR